MRIIDSTGATVADGNRQVRVTMRIGVQNVDGSHMEIGDTYVVPDWFGLQLVNSGRAMYVAPPADPPPSAPEVIEHHDPVPEARDPQPRRRR